MTANYQQDYPRPLMARKNWENLNGEWDFRFDDEKIGEIERWYEGFDSDIKILVPFTYETKKSGVHDERSHHTVWYERTIEAAEMSQNTESVLLHFEGCDFEAKVWVNGRYIGKHRGGYARFSFDISMALKTGKNCIVVKAEDSFSKEQPRGKQRWKAENFECWYLQSTGIWKTVWLERVPGTHIRMLQMIPDLKNAAVDIPVDVSTADPHPELSLYVSVFFHDQLIAESKTPIKNTHTLIKQKLYEEKKEIPQSLKMWSPESPDLYDVVIQIKNGDEAVDTVTSYFAMREIRIIGNEILLNGKKIYQKLILDQGYWKDSNLTPENEEALLKDIRSIKKLGYNGLRKHQKIEDERFLYWCDAEGVFVWCEMPSAYTFSEQEANEIKEEWQEIVLQNQSHPCIITWTLFNESWGIPEVRTNKNQQLLTEEMYQLTKELDPQKRPVITNDGWEHTISDILTIHDYAESGEELLKRYFFCSGDLQNGRVYLRKDKPLLADGYGYRGQPVILSEYGGIAYKSSEEGWGYGKKESSDSAFLRRFENTTAAIKNISDLCGYCYTQLTDVQQEMNGLLDEERNFKIDPYKIESINDK